LTARGVGPGPGANGEAAGEAKDPFTLLPGTYDYAFTIAGITLETDTERDFAGVSAFATDSRFSDPLWVLEIGVLGLLSDIGDIIIGFDSNAILGLDDTVIENQLRDAFIVSSGTATLATFELFDTTYEVDQTIVGSIGLNAGVTRAVPEPATFALFGVGLVVFGFTRRSRRVLAEGECSGRRRTKDMTSPTNVGSLK
jgi:hypothetical protein